MIPGNSFTSEHTISRRGSSSSRRGSIKPLAIITSLVMIISTVVLGHPTITPQADAQTSGTWDWGWTTDTANGRRVLSAPMTPVDHHTLYGSAYGGGANSPFGSTTNGWVGYYVTGGATPTDGTVNLIGKGNTGGRLGPTGQWMSTLAIDADPYGDRGNKYAYMWSWAADSNLGSGANSLNNNYPTNIPSANILVYRIAEGQTVPELMPVPAPNFFNGTDTPNTTAYNYWSGGEIIQSTGEIFFSGGECSGINRNFRMMVFDPQTLTYNYSGRLQPKNPGDNIFDNSDGCGGTSYVASDMALDANGKAYILVFSRLAAPAFNLPAGNRMWLVRVDPSATGGWTYNLVSYLTRHPSEPTSGPANTFATGTGTNMIYGMAFYEGILYASMYNGNALIAINPMTGQVRNVGPTPGTGSLRPTYVQDLASGQTAIVIQGVVFNDEEADGSITGNDGIGGQRVALYMLDRADGQYIYEGSEVTGPGGDFSFLVGGNGDYIVRLVEPSIADVNATQTYASGGGNLNPVTAKCLNGDITTKAGGECVGAVIQPHTDADLPTDPSALGTDKSTQPADMSYYTQVQITSDREVADANFAITTRGSYGDSSVGPTTGPIAPAHVNGVNPQVWLGESLGSYAGPASDNTAHNSTDDGVFVQTYAGNLPMTANAFVATMEYTLVGQLSGPQVGLAKVSGWSTSVGGTSWNSATSWTPTLSGSLATGTWTPSSTSASGPMHFRAQVSTVNIMSPTNSAGDYYSPARWVTPGEIEDYFLTIGTSVYRPAARTLAGTSDFTVAGVSFTNVTTTVQVAPGVSATPGTPVNLTAIVPDTSWTVSEVLVKDTLSGATLSTLTPTPSTDRLTWSFTITPELNGDVVLEVVFAPSPDPDESELTVDPVTQVVNNDITATVTVRTSERDLLPNVEVSFSKVSSDITLSATTCRTNAQGQCSITLTSAKAGIFTDELSATVIVGTTPVAVSGSPATVTFIAGPLSYVYSFFEIDPVADLNDTTTWKVANGADYYTGILHARDDSDNPITDLDLSTIVFSAPVTVDVSTVTNNLDGTYSVRFSTTTLNKLATASVRVAGGSITASDNTATTLPVPFKAGPISWTKSTLTVDYTLLGVSAPAHATATIVDEFDNPIEGVAVTFALAAVAPATSHDAALVPTSGVELSDEYGKAYATITNNTAETVSLSAMALDGTTPRHLTGSPVQITWEAGDIDATESSFRVYITDTTATQVRADGNQSWTGELTARDSNRNLLVDLTPAQLATLTWGVTPSGVTVSSVASAGAGIYTVTYTTTKAGAYTATLHTGAPQIGADEQIIFVPGPVDPDRSKVSVSPTTTAVGTPAVVTVQVFDAYDNPIPGLTNTAHTGITITGTSPGLPDVTMMGAMSETADGVYEFTITSFKVGTFTIEASVTDILITQKPTVTFTHGGVSAAHSSFEMVDNNALADGTAKNSARATARDQYDNPVPGATVVVDDKTTASELIGFLDPTQFTGTTDTNGELMIYWTSTKKGTFTAEGMIDNLRPPTGVMSQITFTTGLADPNNSTMTVYPASPIQVGSIYTVTATIRDTNSLLLEDERVEFTLNPTTPATLSNPYCITNGAGQCSVTVTSLLVTDVTIHGFVSGAAGLAPIAGHGVPAQASGQTVSFSHGPVCLPPDVATPVDPTHISRVEVTTPGAEANGSAAELAMVYAYDCYGNPVPGVTVSSSTSVTQLATTYRTPTTTSDGTAVIEYRSTLAGAHDAVVRLDGRIPAVAISYAMAPRSDGQITLNFGSGVAVPGNSFLTISPTSAQEVGSTFVVTATLRDATLNPVSGTTIMFTSGADLGFTPQASCISGPDGTCQVSVRSTKSGTYEIKGFLGLLEVSNSVSATFTAGPVCILPTCLTRVEVTTNGQKADGTSRNIATVYAFDQYDNPVAGQVVSSTPTIGTTGLTAQANPNPTNDQGVSTIWYTATATGSYDADVVVAGLTPRGSPVTLFFGVGDGDPAHSQWDITPAGPLVVGEGTANTYTARAIVRDEDNILVPGEIVTFGVDRTGPIPGPNPNSWSCMTATDGSCSITIHSTVAGTFSFTARLATGSIMNTTTGVPATSRAWKADEVCSQAEGCEPVDPTLPPELRTRIEVTTNNATADGIARNQITAWGFDKWGNPVVGARVDSTRVVGADPIAIQTGINPLGDSGSSTIWYTSMVADSYQVNVAIDDVRPVGSPASLTFTPGEVCVVEAGCEPTGPGTDPLKQTRVAVTTNNHAVDGPPNVATAWAFDRTGNPVPNVDVSFVKALASSNLVIDATCTTLASGQCTVGATAKTAGDHQARASVAGTELTDHGSPLTFTFTTGELCIIEAGCEPDDETPPSRYTRVELLDNNAHVVRGGVTPEDRHLNLIGVYAFDKYGNPVADAVFDLVADTTYLKFHTGLVHQSATSLTSSGTVAPDTVAVYTNNSEDHFVTASVNGVELTLSGSPLEVWFVDPPVITYPSNNSIINDSPIPVSGTATNAGSLVDVFIDGVKVCEATIGIDHTWMCNAVGVIDGSHVITAQKHSRDGLKRSEVSDPVAVRTDTVPPRDPTVDDTNGSKITGTSDPDTTVTVYDRDGRPVPGCVAVKPDSTGRFVCFPQVELADGDKITVIAEDEAGNRSNPVVVTVRGIAILILHPVRQRGEPQVVSGLHFNPGERVRLVVNSDPLDVGTLSADSDGTVTFTFDIPRTFEPGVHTATLTGDESGIIAGTFQVVVPVVPTGGVVQGAGKVVHDRSCPQWRCVDAA